MQDVLYLYCEYYTIFLQDDCIYIVSIILYFCRMHHIYMNFFSVYSTVKQAHAHLKNWIGLAIRTVDCKGNLQKIIFVNFLLL